MPTFVLPSSVRKKTWIGPSGKLRTVSFPCRTDDLALIKDLKSAGAKERVTRRPPIFTNPTSEGGE